jgi:uncharacterized protein (TIGR00730 family)
MRIAVYCGSKAGANDTFRATAEAFGRELVRRGIGLVYGGARVGLMGILADTVLRGSGEVIGVIPAQLQERELAHPGLSQLHVVGSMHERKALMADQADGFVALPGGVGTLDEFFEMWTWGQLGIHTKPLGLLDVEGYFDHLLAFADEMVRAGFLSAAHRAMISVSASPGPLLDAMATAVVPPEKWRDLR